MNITTSVRHPDKNSYITLHEWQIRFCQGNHCAALLLSYFSAWHDWKLRNDQYYRRSNDIAEIHGDGRPNNENAYLFFTTEELIDGCMGLYGKKSVCDGLELLVSLNVISVHKNPNPRYHFDKTKYFQFYPQVCNRWIAKNYPVDSVVDYERAQDIDYNDMPKMADRESKNARRSDENGRPSRENSQAITNTTNNTTNRNKSINACDDHDQEKIQNQTTEIETVTDALVQAGFSRDRLNYPDAKLSIQHLIGIGATKEIFLSAYQLAYSATQGKGFGVNYLAKVVDSLLKKSPSTRNNLRSSSVSNQQSSQVVSDESQDYHYRNHVEGIKSWAGDLI
jgi:hypothetical protein